MAFSAPANALAATSALRAGMWTSTRKRVVRSTSVPMALAPLAPRIRFLEIGTDEDHVHFLVQSVPMYSVRKIVRVIKSITAREVFQRCPQVRKRLWGGEFWSDGYFASTVGKHGDEATIGRYVQGQGQAYTKRHEDGQLSLF